MVESTFVHYYIFIDSSRNHPTILFNVTAGRPPKAMQRIAAEEQEAEVLAENVAPVRLRALVSERKIVSRRTNFAVGRPSHSGKELLIRVTCALPAEVLADEKPPASGRFMRLIHERPTANETVSVLHIFDAGVLFSRG